MNTYEKFSGPMGCDAAGRPIDPFGVVWTGTDIKGMFSDAFERDENAEIVENYWHEYLGWCAFVRNKVTQLVSLYGMNVKTRKPYLIKPRPGEPPRRRKRRPRMSREWKLWQAKRRWEDR